MSPTPSRSDAHPTSTTADTPGSTLGLPALTAS